MAAGTAKKKKNCPKLDAAQFVTKDLCNERSTRLNESIQSMERNLTEKLSGIDKKVDGIINGREAESKEKSHDYRRALLTILSGAAVALLAWALAHLHL